MISLKELRQNEVLYISFNTPNSEDGENYYPYYLNYFSLSLFCLVQEAKFALNVHITRLHSICRTYKNMFSTHL